MIYLKKIASFSLSVVILITHLIALDHSLEHNSNHKEEIHTSLEFLKVTDLDQDCTVCDIYLDVEIAKTPNYAFTLLTPKLIITSIFEKQQNFSSVIFQLKKSRAPPVYRA